MELKTEFPSFFVLDCGIYHNYQIISLSACEDLNEHCAFWSGVDECNINPNYMLVYCKKSCGVCGDYGKSI